MNINNDIYQQVTDKIVADLQKDQLTWRQPWSGNNIALRPLRSNNLPYTGINTIMLWAAAAHKSYQSPYWFTFKQALAMKASIRKGEKSSQVIYADKFTKKEKEENGEETERKIPFLKLYHVFNAEQIDGLPPAFYKAPEIQKQNPDEKIDHLEKFFRNTQVKIVTGNDPAYSPLADMVEIPPFECFEKAEDYYAILAHEVTHWTGHKNRLKRDFGCKSWGDEGYAKEELVAELASCFLGADLGFSPKNEEQHAAYIKSWLNVLNNDKKFIFNAAAHAQRAVEYLNNLQPKSAAVNVPALEV